MARGDGTGPEGRGPMTGRGAGFCAGGRQPGIISAGGRFRRNQGSFGFRNRRGGWWERLIFRSPAHGLGYQAHEPEIERKALVNRANALQHDLDLLRDRLKKTEAGEE